MHKPIDQDESWWERVARSPVFLYLVPPIVGILVAAAAAWLVPSVTYVKASVTRYELRYVEGVGNVEYPAGNEMARVRQYDWPSGQVATSRLPRFLTSGALAGLLLGAALHLRSKRLYQNGRRVYFKDGDLLPIGGEPIQGELLPPVRGIGPPVSGTELSSERAPSNADRAKLAK